MKRMPKYCLICLFFLSAFIFMACTTANPSSQTDTSEPKWAYDYEMLFSYKSSYIGDAVNARNLLNHLAYPNNLPIEKIELQTDKSPYKLAIFFQLNLEKGQEYNIDYSMIAKDSALLLALIDNLEVIDYNFVQDDYGLIFSMTRDDIDSLLGESSKTYGKSKNAFTTVLPQKIETISYQPDVKSKITYDGDIVGHV